MLKILTRDFGEVEISEDDVITFTEPIFGFKDYSRFAVLTEESIGPDFAWLQSVEDASVCFILVNPSTVVGQYNPVLPKRVAELIETDEPMFWLVAVLRDTLEKSTVNLKSPIVINPVSKNAAQVILEDDLPIRYPLMGSKGGL